MRAGQGLKSKYGMIPEDENKYTPHHNCIGAHIEQELRGDMDEKTSKETCLSMGTGAAENRGSLLSTSGVY